VDVRINQAGKQCAIAQVDHVRAGRMLDRSPHFNDTFAVHENLARRDDVSGLHVQQTGGVQDDGLGRGWLRLGSALPDESR
jgi:hypothetical protein